MPADATGLAFANVREIMNSEFRQRIRQVLPTGEGKDQLFNETGIDIEHDIESVVAASLVRVTRPTHGLVLVRGRVRRGPDRSLSGSTRGPSRTTRATAS